MTDEPGYVETGNTRSDEQRAIYEEIAKTGLCPFCEKNMPKLHKGKVICVFTHWIIAENAWPYEYTKAQYVIIARRHVLIPTELSQQESSELMSAFIWMLEHLDIDNGAFCMRFGEPFLTSASVAHLHAQVIVPDPEADDRVRFPIGPKKRNKK